MFINPDQIYDLRGRTILGVNPPVYDFAWFDLWAKPAGLLNLLGLLRDRGNRVHLLDVMTEGREKPLTLGRWKVRRSEIEKPALYRPIPRRYYRFGLEAEAVRDRLSGLPAPDLILLTSIMTYWYPGVWEMARLLRGHYPRTPIVLGGLYATLCPGHAAWSGADHLLVDPAPPRAVVTPLDLYAEPGHGLLTTSYGCPMRCQYCASSLLTPRFQPRPLADIIADLEHQLARGVGDLAFYDDALLWEREERFYPLARYLLERHPDLRLHSPNGLSVALIDERCSEMLYAAGLKTLRLSLEGVDDFTGAVSSRKADAAGYARAVANLRRAGYGPESLETYILAGLPGQKTADVERTIKYVRAAGARPKLCEFSPIPGTELFAAARRDHPQMVQEPLWHNNTVYAAYLAGRLEPAELQNLKMMCRDN